MNNLEYAIIQEFNRTKFINELDILTDSQIELLNDFCSKAWAQVTESDLNTFNFNDETKTLYSLCKNAIEIVLKNNYLEFSDKRCYDYLLDGVYTMITEL